MWIPFLHRIRWVVYGLSAICLVGGVAVVTQNPAAANAWILAAAGVVGVVTQLAIRYEMRRPGRDPRNTIG